MEFKCNLCNKYYKSYKSLWNHNKTFHKEPIIPKISQNIHSNIQENIHENIHKCIFCKKIYSSYFVKWRHEKKCSTNNNLNKNIIISENEKLKKEINDLKKSQDEFKKSQKEELEKFKNELLKSIKIHPPDLLEKL